MIFVAGIHYCGSYIELKAIHFLDMSSHSMHQFFVLNSLMTLLVSPHLFLSNIIYFCSPFLISVFSTNHVHIHSFWSLINENQRKLVYLLVLAIHSSWAKYACPGKVTNENSSTSLAVGPVQRLLACVCTSTSGKAIIISTIRETQSRLSSRNHFSKFYTS